jgi:hypothetical protein
MTITVIKGLVEAAEALSTTVSFPAPEILPL